MPAISLTSSSHLHLATVATRGDVDHTAVPELTGVIREALAVPGIRTLVVDLSGATYLGAAALGALVGARKRCRLRGVQLVVQSPDLRLRRLFTITNLESMLSDKLEVTADETVAA